MGGVSPIEIAWLSGTKNLTWRIPTMNEDVTALELNVSFRRGIYKLGSSSRACNTTLTCKDIGTIIPEFGHSPLFHALSAVHTLPQAESGAPPWQDTILSVPVLFGCFTFFILLLLASSICSGVTAYPGAFTMSWSGCVTVIAPSPMRNG